MSELTAKEREELSLTLQRIHGHKSGLNPEPADELAGLEFAPVKRCKGVSFSNGLFYWIDGEEMSVDKVARIAEIPLESLERRMLVCDGDIHKLMRSNKKAFRNERV